MAEFQRRGVVHFHTLIRVDGSGDGYPAPAVPVTVDQLTEATRMAVAEAKVTTDPYRPGGPVSHLRFGRQVDIQPVHGQAQRDASTGPMYNDGGYIVHNNMWNTSGYRVSETVEACSYRSWNAIATADNSSGDGAVKTYPNVHKDYRNWGTGYEPPLSNYPVLSSTFAASGPNTGIYNIAYDIWLNGVGNGGSNNREVMIWTDNQGQRPAGSVVASGLQFGGQTWTLWATGDNHILSFVPSKDMPSGTVNMRAMLDYLISQGRVPANSTLGQICFGVEVVSTDGSPATFNFTNFSLTDR